MITLKNVSYRISGKTLLEDVSIKFLSGKINLIIGPNGAGKSTLIKILGNQIRPVSGEVLYGENRLDNISVSSLAKTRAVLSQEVEMTFPITVGEMVMMGRYPHFTGKPTEKDWKACEEAADLFEIKEMLERNYLTLSGGEKQRVHFARVFAQIWYPVAKNSRYLILDEPLTFLDIRYQYEFMKKMKELSRQSDLTIIGVIHDLNLASRFGDNITLLNQGKVIADGDKFHVFTKSNIMEAYGLEPKLHFTDDTVQLFF